MPAITDNVQFNTIAREWRLKWDEKEEKLALTQVQEVLDSLGDALGKIKGAKSIQRVVCGGCHDYKVIVALPEKLFKKWEEDKFAPEETFLDAVKKIDGVSAVETQTYTLMDVRIKKAVEKRADPTDLPGSKKLYTLKQFSDFYGAQEAKRLWDKAGRQAAQAERAMNTNSAFVFIKPHAVTDAVKEVVKKGLEEKGIRIYKEGTLTSETIDKKKLIDQHYYAIASKATILKPKELNVPEDKFKEKFGLEWKEALDKGIVYNAMDACEKLGLDADGLDKLWGTTKKAGDMIKFGGGFYCGHLKVDGKDPIYAFNGFFMSMRAKYCAPGEKIHYYSVGWDATKLSWADFRGKVLGPTDPKEAPADSLRGVVLKDWEKLGLKAEPNVGDNGIHASASPFEALAERMNWMGAKAERDPFGKMMLDAGIKANTIKAWSVDPQVLTGGEEGKKGSLFDQLEDMDAADCLKKSKELSKINRPPPRERPGRKEKGAKGDLVKE